jgi:DNA-binding transcriptional regulator YdaS (Cro superfamily)
MSQTAYGQTFVKGYEGILADSRKNLISSLQAAVAITPGRGVVKMYGKENQCRLPCATKLVITDNGGTYTAGALASVIVTSVASYTINSSWATDKDTGMAAHAAAILAGIPDALSCTYVGGSTHTITLILKNSSVVSSATAVTGITGNMTISSETITSADTAAMLVGVAINPGTVEQTSAGVVAIAATEAVSVMEEGAIYVIPEETVTSDDDVYFRVQTNSTKLAGMFGTSADSGKCVLLSGARWVEGGTGLSTVAKLQLNLPQ